jgi:hypothetical protein
MGYHVQSVYLENGALTDSINILAGRNTPPENIMYVHQVGTNSDDDETLDITGKMIGCDTAVTANVHTQLTLTGDEVIRLDLSSEAKGYWQLTFTVDALDADQWVKVWIITW